MMIIASQEKLGVGEVHRGPVTDINLDWQMVAFLVLREATEAEYRENVAEVSADVPNPPFEQPMWFYVVSMD